MASNSLDERVMLFKRRYPGKKTTSYKIRKLYARHKIKKKVIRMEKTPRQTSLIDIAIDAAQLSQDVQLALDRGMKIVQLDEFVITKRTWPAHAWANKKENIFVNQADAYNRALAVVMAISRERGVELVDIYEKSINRMKFKLFLERLRQLNLFSDIMLVMDNLSVHKSLEIKERMTELGFSYTYTPAYSPQYNGIEEVIGIGKGRVKKMRLQKIMSGQHVDLREMITEAFTTIDTQQVAKCIARSMHLLNLN